MAQRRMLNKRISISEDVNELSIKAALLYTWMIAHQDDLGLLPCSAKWINATVVPMRDEYTKESIDEDLKQMQDKGIIEIVKYHDKEFFRMSAFDREQSPRKDRTPSTYLPVNLPKTAKEGWDELLKQGKQLVNQRYTNGLPEVNQRFTNGNPSTVQDSSVEDRLVKSSEAKERECEGKPTPVSPTVTPSATPSESHFDTEIIPENILPLPKGLKQKPIQSDSDIKLIAHARYFGFDNPNDFPGIKKLKALYERVYDDSRNKEQKKRLELIVAELSDEPDLSGVEKFAKIISFMGG